MKKITLLPIMMLLLMATVNAQNLTFELVKDINPDGDSAPTNMYKFNNLIYFSATDGITGAELWVTDGTEDGTVLLKDINPGEGSSNPERFAPAGDLLFFIAEDGTNGQELWVTDGTTDGTVMVKDINPDGGSFPFYPVEMDGKLYFRADDGTNGTELWVSDGTEEGTYMIKNIRDGDSGSNPSYMTVYNGKIYFSAIDSNGGELWCSDGTAEGTVMVKDINPDGWSMPTDLYVFNGKIYFSADNGTEGSELWISDGTSEGTYMLKDISEGPAGSNPGNFIGLDDYVYFRAYMPATGRELWKTDGTEEGTMIIKDLDGATTDGTVPQFDICVFNNKIVFTGITSEYGAENWVTDGTADGTHLLKDIFPGTESSMSMAGKVSYYVHNNRLYFRALNDFETYYQLYISDGTEDGTYMISPDGENHVLAVNYTPYFNSLNNKLFFRANYTEEGHELWMVSDGMSGLLDTGKAGGNSVVCYLDKQDILNISSQEDIISVNVYSANGSLITTRKVNSMQGTIDLSGTSERIFIVRVQATGKNSTFKVIKL